MPRIFTLILPLTLLLAACAPQETPAAPPPSETSTPAPQPATDPAMPVSSFTTHHTSTGSRTVQGGTNLQTASVLDIPLNGTPLWLVSAPWQGGVVFAAVLENGSVQAFKISGQAYEPIPIAPTQLPADMPPLLLVTENSVELSAPPADASPLTNPILIDGGLAYIASNGDLVLVRAPQPIRLPINALPDTRILADENGRLLLLTEPTTRYDHGVLGDAVEAAAITLIETRPEPRVVQTISIPAPDVIEGIAPIWADLNNDGANEIIVTLTNAQAGARIAAYREDGSLLAQSRPIGQGYRWRHQLAVAEFEAGSSPLLVSVRTPHIGGIVEYLRINGDELEVVQEIRGYSTHNIGSRNLDSALAGDFNNDGIPELLAPDQPHTSLAVISFNEVLFPLPLPGALTSNLSAAEQEGRLYVGAGTQGTLRVWVP